MSCLKSANPIIKVTHLQKSSLFKKQNYRIPRDFFVTASQCKHFQIS